jgi:hypothetical protein
MMRAAVGGLVTALVFALVGGAWLSEAVGEMHPIDSWGLVGAAWFVLWSALPVVVLAGVPLGWGVSSLLGSRRPVVVHVVAWAAIGLALGAATTAAFGGPSWEVAAVAAASAGLGCAVGAVVPGGAGRRVLSRER